jgi:anaerobic dimethyl sulfoxide reductase subunit B (iron-sulfur subunit)
MARLGFYFDSRMCIGCRTCQIACKDKNDLEVGINFRQVSSFEVGKYPNAIWFHYSSSCNHCENPKCVEGCPTGAMHIAEDGTVQPNPDKCIGCQYCTWNCPYGVPQYIEAKGKVLKCDSCKDLRDKGENPACVDACIMRCLKFGDLDKLEAEYGPGLVKELPIMEKASKTNPSILIKPKDAALNPNYKKIEI